MTVRIGLIGAGIMGADHARTIVSGVRSLAIALAARRPVESGRVEPIEGS